MDRLTDSLFHYTACGLDNIYLASGVDVFDDADFGESYSIKNADELECVITFIVAFKPAELNGKEIRFLRVQTDLSQKELAQKIGVTDQTVSLWERDRQEIQRTTSLLLRSMAICAHVERAPVNDLIEHIDTTDFDEEAWSEIILRWHQRKEDDDHHWNSPRRAAL